MGNIIVEMYMLFYIISFFQVLVSCQNQSN